MDVGLWTALVIGLYLAAHSIEAPRSLRDPVSPHLVALELAAAVVGAAWVARASPAVYAPGAALCMALAVAAAFSAAASALRWDVIDDDAEQPPSWDAAYLLHPSCVACTAAVIGLVIAAAGRTGPRRGRGTRP